MEPLFHSDIHAWLTTFSPYDELVRWLRQVPKVHEECPPVCLTGPSCSGKTLLVEGIIRIWIEDPYRADHSHWLEHVEDYAEGSRYLQFFNSEIEACPVLHLWDRRPENLKLNLTTLVKTCEWRINEKYLEPRVWRGYLRVVLDSNQVAPRMVNLSTTQESVEALAKIDKGGIRKRIAEHVLAISAGEET